MRRVNLHDVQGKLVAHVDVEETMTRPDAIKLGKSVYFWDYDTWQYREGTLYEVPRKLFRSNEESEQS